MYACAKFVSAPFLGLSASPVLGSGSLSVVVLKPSGTLTEESVSSLAAPRRLTSLIPSRSFRPRAISRDINATAKFTGAGAAMVGVAGSEAGFGTVFGSLIIEPLSETKALLLSYLGFALLEAKGLFCLMVAFLIFFAM